MKRYNNYIASIGFFIVALLVTSCSDEQEIELASLEMNARLNLTISTRAAADDQVKGGDGKFSIFKPVLVRYSHRFQLRQEFGTVGYHRINFILVVVIADGIDDFILW